MTRARARKPAVGSRRRSSSPGVLSAVVTEFHELVRLTTTTRRLLDGELTKLSKAGGAKLGKEQHIVWMLIKLSDSVTKLMREGRQLERQTKRTVEEMSEAETFQVLIDAGWKPPAGWSP